VMGTRLGVEEAGRRRGRLTGADVYRGMPGFEKGMEAEGLAHNRQFIEQAKREGAQMKDIGPDFEKRAIEGRASANYEGVCAIGKFLDRQGVVKYYRQQMTSSH
jgi:hypothetical protein